jgi:glycosyltransferase involved in cell wall biosynthesis
MKIGLLTTSFPRAEGDPPGSFVLGFARALAARGHQLDVLAPMPHEPHYIAPPRFPGVTVHWVRYLAPRALQRTFYGAGVLDNLRSEPLLSALGLGPFVVALAGATLARRRGWDAVISHWALPCALIAGELAGKRPHLAVLHSADVFVLERLPWAHVVATRIARQSDALLFSSRELRRRFLALLSPVARSELGMRAHVCAMGIEPAARAAEKRGSLREKLRLKRFTVLSLGRLIPLKGIAHAITAVAALPETELVIAGYGPEKQALEEHAQQTGARVRFVGELAGADKESWLQAADAFVLPSIVLPDGRSEGMPTTLLEAMEHGLPVIASDVGGVADVVQSGQNGFLVAAGEPEAIVEALRTLLTRATRTKLSKGARETAALYHWSALAPRIEELLRDADWQTLSPGN